MWAQLGLEGLETKGLEDAVWGGLASGTQTVKEIYLPSNEIDKDKARRKGRA